MKSGLSPVANNIKVIYYLILTKEKFYANNHNN